MQGHANFRSVDIACSARKPRATLATPRNHRCNLIRQNISAMPPKRHSPPRKRSISRVLSKRGNGCV